MTDISGFVCGEIQVGTAEYDQLVTLRNQILREPLGLAFTSDEQAEDLKSIHLAGWLRGELAACLVLTPLSQALIRMRQVAVRADFQGKRLGSVLVAYSEAFAIEHGYGEMMLHARETVVPFYERLGYSSVGDMFVEVSLPHYEMRKTLRV